MRGLEDINWLTLDGGREAPQLLRELVAEDAGHRAQALEAFWAGPLRGGARSAAAIAAVPFLVQALEAPHVDHAALLHVLANVALARADTEGCRRFDLEALLRSDPFPDGDWSCDRVWLARECWVAVGRGCATYRRFLGKEHSVETRSRAARLLALFPSQGRQAIAELRRIAMNEREPEALRASAFIALGHFVRIELVEGEGLLVSAATRIGAALAEPSSDERKALVWTLVDEEAALKTPQPWPWPSLEVLVKAQLPEAEQAAPARRVPTDAAFVQQTRAALARADVDGRVAAVEATRDREPTPELLELLGRLCTDEVHRVRDRAVQVVGLFGARARSLAPMLMRAGESRDVLLAIGRVATHDQVSEWLGRVEHEEVAWALWAMRPASAAALRAWLDGEPGHRLSWMLAEL